VVIILTTKNELFISNIKQIDSTITFSDYWDHFLARMGYKREGHYIEPGLYSLGNSNPNSPVFVTANYTLSFDALRSSLQKIDSYILVLDTKGINVWCAAGKGTFSTAELLNRIEKTGLHKTITHRRLILPQLGAPGIAAFEVKKRSGFNVEYGPIRASDIPQYLMNQEATSKMRRVSFDIIDRIVLIPIELNVVLLPMILVAIILYFLGGFLEAVAVITAVLAGTVLFPILLPWLPTKDFSTKGFILGVLTAIPFSLFAFLIHQGDSLWMKTAYGLTYMLIIPSIVSYLALNFTGSTPFTSKSGVKTEIFKYIPYLAGIFIIGVIIDIILFIVTFKGVI